MAPAAIVVFIGGYVESLDIFGITSGWPVYLAFYAVFVGIHLLGVGEALKVTFASPRSRSWRCSCSWSR